MIFPCTRHLQITSFSSFSSIPLILCVIDRFWIWRRIHLLPISTTTLSSAIALPTFLVSLIPPLISTFPRFLLFFLDHMRLHQKIYFFFFCVFNCCGSVMNYCSLGMGSQTPHTWWKWVHKDPLWNALLWGRNLLGHCWLQLMLLKESLRFVYSYLISHWIRIKGAFWGQLILTYLM